MNGIEVFRSELSARKIDADRITEIILENHEVLPAAVDEIVSGPARVRFACSKALLLLSAKKPDLLYEKIDDIAGLLKSENQILKWNAIAMIGNMAGVDREGRAKALLRKLYSFLSSGELITANTAIDALGKIARVIPEEQGKIVTQLLKIEHAKFQTVECRNIAIGKALQALQMIVGPGCSRKEILDFAQRQTGNSRKATAEKAKLFLRVCGRVAALTAH